MASAKAKRTSFLLLLLHIFPATLFEIQKDCIVSSQIAESDILFDTLEFLALIPDEPTRIRARISCADDKYHYIEWNSQTIKAKTTSTYGPYAAPDNSSGWMRFTLGYMGNLTLLDGRRQPWLPGNISFECPVYKVELSGSSFVRMCPTNTPVWKVEGKDGVDIPLQVNDETPENLTLFSTTTFRAVFSVDDSEFHLGMSGESLMTGRHHGPLLGGISHRLVLKTYKENGSTMFQVLSAGLPIHTESLKQVPKRMRVQSQDGRRFVLVQTWYTRKAGEPHSNAKKQCKEQKYIWLLLSMLISVTMSFVILLVQHCRLFRSHKQCGSPNTVLYQPSLLNAASMDHSHPATMTPAGPRTPNLRVGHFVSASNTSRFPPHSPLFPPHASLSLHHPSSQEEVYYEMTPLVAAAPPPKSFDMEPTNCMETINDVYQSADYSQ
ncbi:uncharacterized protein LOC125039796 [Penaeus chinensis]|uniref:uncharacterized protein LOC125039796 n=1 Tax=Penaeus chinensis TaxID=139456 RepID=UPI001FB6B956|nr:uncharacterized protein LOC125039796 [Penaeus chinensis]